VVGNGSLTVNGGSNLTADSLRGSDGGIGEVSTLVFDAAGTTIDLVGTNTNRIDIGAQGNSTMTISGGAVIDAASVACIGVCNDIIGNGAGSTANLTITGSGSRIDSQSTFSIGQAIVVPGFGTPGGSSAATVDILAGGVLNTQSVNISSQDGGGSTIGTEQSTATVTVSGAGSRWDNVSDGAFFAIANGIRSNGTLNIENGGEVNIQSTTSNTATLMVTNTGFSDPANNHGGAGDINVDGAGYRLDVVGDGEALVTIGQHGTGSIDVTNSANVLIDANNGSARINVGPVSDASTGSQGSMSVDGSTVTVQSASTTGGTSTVGVRSSDTLVGAANEGTLALSNGANLFINHSGSGSAAIDVARGGNGIVSITDSTVSINNTGTGSAVVNIGQDGGTGVVNVTNSTIDLSTVSGITTVSVGRATGGVATMTLSNSTLSLKNFLSVGREGATGTLNVENGSTVTNTGANGLTRIGRVGGTGTMNVNGASTVTTNFLQIGRDASSNGDVNVEGVGTAVNVNDTLQIGRDSQGAMTVGTGAVVNSATTLLGTFTGSTGTLNISGSGSQMNISGLSPNSTVPTDNDGSILLVGRNGNGTINLSNGAGITIAPGVPTGVGTGGGLLIGGSGSSPTGTGNGTVNVDGSGTSLMFSSVNGQAGSSTIGRDGVGRLNVTNGGLVDGSAQNIAVVGRKAGGVGVVTVSGTGSEWRAGNNLFIGTDVDFGTATAIGNGGTGIVTLSNGGTLMATNVLVESGGVLNGSGGTVNGNVTVQNGGIFAPGASPGTMTINGDLNIDTGVLQLETEGGVADSIIVSGDVNIGPDAVVQLFFDLVPTTIDIADFITAGTLNYDPGFDASDIVVFTSVAGNVGQSIDVTFGGTTQSFTAEFGSTVVSAPSAFIIFAFGILGTFFRRRQSY
jgi:T5SS/PEP-CTERM-associated repeat protein